MDDVLTAPALEPPVALSSGPLVCGAGRRPGDRPAGTLTDLPGLRRAARAGTGLHAPGQSPGYRPSAALDRFVRARDRRCRFPGCRRPVPRGGELDHHTPWPAGRTAAADLAGYCTGHHRSDRPRPGSRPEPAKGGEDGVLPQAPGWRHALAPDGTLTVTTPSGLTAVTTPPSY